MDNTIAYMLDNYENHFPQHSRLNDMAIADLHDKKGKFHGGRGVALNPAYFLDGGTQRRPLFQENFDGMHESEKAETNKKVLDLAEIASMLYHPAYAVDESGDEHNLSENRKMSREIIHHLIDRHGEDAQDRVLQEIVVPLTEMLLDDLADGGNILNQLLPYIMTENTEHDPEDYRHLLHQSFVIPAVQGHYHGHWKKGIQELMHGDLPHE